MSSTPRSGAVDAVRVLGVVAVVIGHVWADEVLRMGLYSWHVPVFFFLTGYFWKPGRTLTAEVRNRFRTLARPYLFWLCVILVIWSAVAHVRDHLTLEHIADPLYGGFYATRPFSAFWFVTVLFFAALAYRAVERLPVAVQGAVVVTGLLVGHTAGELLARTPLSIGSAWPCLAFIALGRLFRHAEPRLGAPLPAGIGLLVGPAGLVATGWSAPLDIKQGDYGSPVLSVVVSAAICAGLVLVARSTFAHAPAAAHRAATVLARAGFVVILSHAVVLMLLDTAGGGLTDFLLALLVPWVLGLLLLRTRLSGWAAGSPRRSHRPVETLAGS
ncbi:acyltransferase family protein [Kocuria sp. M1N1S27]|uniref:acyltransferase family protein n=1 Tax=Kocuria kalidii TaxID=3376283 RepID=UPI00379A8EE1